MLWLAGYTSALGAERIAQDSLVKLYLNRSWLPHGSETYTLEFKDTRYSHFLGVGYAVVPEKDAIVFFTQRDGWSTYLHIVPLHKGKDVTIKLGVTSLGSGFGWPAENHYAHYIERINGDVVIFILRAYVYNKDGEAFRDSLDLKTGKLKEIGVVKLVDAKPTDQAKPVPIMQHGNAVTNGVMDAEVGKKQAEPKGP